MDRRPYIFIALLMLTVSVGFAIGFHSASPPQQIALNWSVPTGPDAYPARAK